MFGSMSEVQLRLYIYIYAHNQISYFFMDYVIKHYSHNGSKLFIIYWLSSILLFSSFNFFLSKHAIACHNIQLWLYSQWQRDRNKYFKEVFLSCFVFFVAFFPFIDRTVARQEVKWERGGTGSGKVREPGLEHRMPEAQLRFPWGIGTDSVSLKQVW